MYVFQGMAIQKRHHEIKRDEELSSSGHDIDDPQCVKFKGYTYAKQGATCNQCSK